ncbi:MAG TPA: hypothetical protein VIH52_03910 [Candidatus Nanoarchaeia archaeon]|nr:hypothetical protein [uncultured archaeon]
MVDLKKAKDIDLLTESEKAVRRNKATPFLALFGLIIFLTIGAGVGIFLLKAGAESEVQELETALVAKNQEWQSVASAAAQLSAVKNKLNSYVAFQKSYPLPNVYLTTLKKYLPTSVTLISLDVDNLGKTTLQASVATAADGYQLYDVLVREKSFSDVKLASITKNSEAEDYLINLSLTIKR